MRAPCVIPSELQRLRRLRLAGCGRTAGLGGCGRAAGRRASGWLWDSVQGGWRCQVAMHGVPQVIASHEPDSLPGAAESGSVAGGASAARTGPQCSRRSNPAARHIRIPAREGGDTRRWSAQAFARVANFKVSPQLLPAPFMTMARDSRRRRCWRLAALRLRGFRFRRHLRR